MRLVTLDSREMGGRPGVWLPSDEILDLAAAPGTLGSTRWLPQSVVSVLAQGEEGATSIARLIAEMDAAGPDERSRLRASGVLLPFPGTELLPPVRRPGLLLMVDDPASVSSGVYVKNPNSAAGPRARVVLTPAAGVDRVAVVPRLGVVLGRALFAASTEEAERAVAAYTLLADLDLRTGQGVDGRQFPRACPIGPALLTIDELASSGPVPVGLRVNGHEVCQRHLDLRPALFAALLSHVSRSYALRPGDIVAIRAGAAGQDDTLGRGDRVALTLGSAMELTFSIMG